MNVERIPLILNTKMKFLESGGFWPHRIPMAHHWALEQAKRDPQPGHWASHLDIRPKGLAFLRIKVILTK